MSLPYEAHRLQLSETATAEAVADLRNAAAAFAAKAGAPDRLQQAIKLAASEALSNVVLHAYADDPEPGPMTLEAWCVDECVIVVVSDEGNGMAPRVNSPGLGIGLPLVANMADDFRVAPAAEGAGTRVAMKFALDGSGLP